LHEITYLQAVLLGLLQGVTEFLPVSSTAHMAVAPQLFHLQDPGAAFSAIAQLGPIVAIIAYFREDLARYVKGILRHPNPSAVIFSTGPVDLDARLGWFTLLGSIPLMIFGVLLEKKIDTSFRRLDVIAVALIVLAFVLWYAERVGKRDRNLEQMTFAQSMNIGFWQILALVPGASRSGTTITAGLFQGLDRESAARFSFLLSIPAIAAAGLYKLLKEVLKMRHGGHLGDILGPAVVGAIVAGVFAYIVVRWFLAYMKDHNTSVFIAYRIALGILILVLLKVGYLQNKPPVEAAPQTAALNRPAFVLR
jgi:undecaprenyl-diphosphatase